MMDIDYIKLIHEHLEGSNDKNVCDYLLADEQYQKASKLEQELFEQYEELIDQTQEQRDLMEKWMDATHATGAAYAAVLFRLGMQSCFSLLRQLGDL